MARTDTQILKEVLRLLTVCDARSAYEIALLLDATNPIHVQVMRLARDGKARDARAIVRELLAAQPRTWADFEPQEELKFM